MEALVKSCICWVCSDMPKHAEPSQNNQVPISLRRVKLFCSSVACSTHLWKLQFNHAVLVVYGPACPEFSKIANRQYLWKGFSDIVVDFLHVVICIL